MSATWNATRRVPIHARGRVTHPLRKLLVSSALGLLAAGIASACASTQQAATASPEPSSPATASLQRADVTSPAPTTGSPSDPSEQPRTFLWTISSPTATVHLLGSVHVASRDLYPISPKIESAFDGAETLVLEITMDQASQLQAAQKLASAGTYPASDSIDKHLESNVLGLLQQQLAASGSSLDAVRSFRPWLVALMLTLDGMQRQGYRADLGVDVYFAEKVKNRKRTVALETADEQVALFAEMTEALQGQMLKETLTRLKELGEDMKRALLLWRTGDAKAMDELLVAPLRADYPDLYQRLFVERNRKMATAIEGYLKARGRYFVVVGAGHLVGPEGILELLRSKGYTPVQE